MSSGEPRPHRDMLRLAIEVVKLLAPYTTRIAVAGSLRRGKALVGDIEIVCQPDEQFLPTGGKGFIEIRQNGLNWKCNRLREKQIFEPRLNSNGNPQSWGDQQKWFRYQGVNVDLYAVLPGYSWGREMVIRTGPGDANGVLVECGCSQPRWALGRAAETIQVSESRTIRGRHVHPDAGRKGRVRGAGYALHPAAAAVGRDVSTLGCPARAA